MAVVLNSGSIVDKKYQVIKKIGQGRIGTVYEVKRLSDQKQLALKIADIFAEDEIKKRLLREIRMMKAIDHKNVIKILDSGEVDDLIYIVDTKPSNCLRMPNGTLVVRISVLPDLMIGTLKP
jgi:serine/threonine protein kinase